MMRSGSDAGATLAEITVAVAVLGILAALTIPAAATVLRFARRTACAANLRQVGMCAFTYADDYDGRLPAEARFGIDDPQRSPAWYDRLPAYLAQEKATSRSVFQCAAFTWRGAQVFTNASPKSLKMNAYLDAAGRPRHYALGTIRGGGEAVVALFVDAVAGETGMGQWSHCLASAVTDERHAAAVNILCLDGRTISQARRPADRCWATAIPWLPSGWAGGP